MQSVTNIIHQSAKLHSFYKRCVCCPGLFLLVTQVYSVKLKHIVYTKLYKFTVLNTLSVQVFHTNKQQNSNFVYDGDHNKSKVNDDFYTETGK